MPRHPSRAACESAAGDSFSRQLQERIATFDQRFHDKFGDLEAKDAPSGAASRCVSYPELFAVPGILLHLR